MKKYLLLLSVLFLLFSFTGIASADFIGNEILDRPILDGANNIAFIDPTLVFPTDGILDSFEFYLKAEPEDKFSTQIYRPTSTANQWELVFSLDADIDPYYYPNGIYEKVSYDELWIFDFHIKAGDVVGWWFGNGAGVIPFTWTRPDPDEVAWDYLSKTNEAPKLGDILTFDPGLGGDHLRDYSIGASYSPVPEPTTILLLASGLFGVAGFRRKFKK